MKNTLTLADVNLLKQAIVDAAARGNLPSSKSGDAPFIQRLMEMFKTVDQFAEKTEYAPLPVHAPLPVYGSLKLWYMRSSHTFRSLPLDVEEALAVMREERDSGETYGMLCGYPQDNMPSVVHAGTVELWPQFEARARPWIERAIALSGQGINKEHS